jgi:hypothetical protein
MVRKGIPDPFGIDEIHFRACFSAPSFKIFMALVIGWVLTVGKHTISHVILTMRLDEARHFASVFRFVAKARWNPDQVARSLFRLMVETLLGGACEIIVVLDDTLTKHCGKKICGAGWQHDGSASKHARRYSYGLCFVVIGLAVRLPGISDRVFCLPYAARLWWPPKANVKPKTLPYQKKIELGLELISLTHSWLEEGERLRVVTDLSYCCETIIKGRPEGVHITGRIRNDSALWGLPPIPITRGQGRPRKKGERLRTPAVLFQDPDLPWKRIEPVCYGKKTPVLVYQFTAIWYHVAGNEHLSFVLCHDASGTHADSVFFDTDLSARAEEIVERYAMRWSIEVTNRETKQLLGAADPQCRSEQSVLRAPMFACWAYSLVVIWFVRQFRSAKHLVATPAPWYRQKKHLTFSDMLAAARRSHFSPRFLEEVRQNNELPKTNPARQTRGYEYTGSAKL